MDIIILILTTWRISSLLVDEGGPFDLFGRLRYLLGVRYHNIDSSAYGENVVSEALSCIWCTSFWVGLVLAICYWTIPVYTTWLCLPLALSGGAIIFSEVIAWLQSNH